MPVTNVKSEWVSGNLVFSPSATGGKVIFGADASGMDFTLYGDTTGASALWDASADSLIFDKADIQLGDTDYVKFGDATGGDVSINWTGSVLQISPAADDTGSINIGDGTTDVDFKIFLGTTAEFVLFDLTGPTVDFGADGKGVDLRLFGETASAYLLWDQSADKLIGSGATTMQIGESTTGVTTAGGTSMIYAYGYHKTNALTGNLRALRGNAVIHVASAAGTAEGVFGRAANGKVTTDTDGVNAGTLIGISALVAGVGKAAAGPSVITAARGIYAQLDINAANLTIDDARGIYVNVQSGNDTANTLTACNLAYLEYESVVGTAPAINSAIKVATVGGATGATALIDASTFNLAVTDTDKVALIKFKNDVGTVVTMFYDTSAGALVFA